MNRFPESAGVVVIGGGIIGTATAYYLAKAGFKDIVLLEKNAIASGSTGRCAGGIRQQWGTPMNVELSMKSVRMFETLEKELGFDFEYYQGGYLLLVRNESQMAQFEKNIALQNSYPGLHVELIKPQEIREVCNAINTDGLIGAAYCKTDGHANPMLANYAYAWAAQKLGAKIFTRAEVTGIDVKDGGIKSVKTSDGSTIKTERVVNAADGHAALIGKMVGLDLPIRSFRHQIMVTEPVAKILDPLVVDLAGNLYFRQTKHGSFVAGQSDKDEPEGFDMKSDYRFMLEVSSKLEKIMPALGNVKIVRQWAGLYGMTPDSQPIIGGVRDVEGYYQAIGFSGHGFMIAPITAKILSEIILHGEAKSADVSSLDLYRFAEGRTIKEPNVV